MSGQEERRMRWVRVIEEWENTPSTDPDLDAGDLAIMCMAVADQEMADARAEVEEHAQVARRALDREVKAGADLIEARAEVEQLTLERTGLDAELRNLRTEVPVGVAALATLERVRALCGDPWIARNQGGLARYQEGVSRRGGVRYGEFIAVADIRAALDVGPGTGQEADGARPSLRRGVNPAT